MLATFWFLALAFTAPWANISGETYRDIRRSTNGGVFGEDSGDPGTLITFTNCLFLNCSVAGTKKETYAGGAISVESTETTLCVSNTRFERCSCDHKNFGGGAIFFLGNILQFSNCIFESDSASHSGGAIFSWAQEANLSKCSANNCTCTSSGGFLESITTKKIILTGCTITACGGKTDGAISSLDTILICNECTFTYFHQLPN